MWKRILLGLLVLFLAIQFIRQPKNLGITTGSADDLMVRTAPASEVQYLLKNACYDCHSDQTRYPWYAKVQPIGWWLAHHVDEGKEHLNFSTFGQLTPKRAAQKLDQCADEVAEDEMPLASYKLTHPAARLTPAQRKLLSNWFGVESGRISTE